MRLLCGCRIYIIPSSGLSTHTSMLWAIYFNNVVVLRGRGQLVACGLGRFRDAGPLRGRAQASWWFADLGVSSDWTVGGLLVRWWPADLGVSEVSASSWLTQMGSRPDRVWTVGGLYWTVGDFLTSWWLARTLNLARKTFW